MCLFVHAVGTTGEDGCERRNHSHGTRCFQCGELLTKESRVAAHIWQWPLGCPCFPRLYLFSTCRRCNHVRHKPQIFWKWSLGRKDTRTRLKRKKRTPRFRRRLDR
jgi:hypothetical protein